MGKPFSAHLRRRGVIIEPFVARLRRRAIIIIAVGGAIYGAGVLALPLVAAWTGLPSWYEPLLTLQEGESICATSRVPIPRGEPCNDARNEELVERLSKGMAAVANHVHYWHRTRAMIVDECARSLQRQCQLMSTLDKSTDGQFPASRKLLDEERARFAQLAGQERSTRIGRYDIGVRIVLGLIDIFVAALSVFLLCRSGASTFVCDETSKCDDAIDGWKAPFAAFTGFGILTAIVTLYGGIGVDDKLWIGADSWVVSRPVWFCNLGSMIGVVIAFAAPMTLLWQLGHRELVPSELKLDSSDGQCGVGGYVSFLHTWTILSFTLAIGPAILWIRFLRVDVASHPTYMAPVAAALALTALLVGRLVTNAILIRARYHKAIADTVKTWDPDEAKKRPPDPTIPFIGENWWKLPATLGAIVLALWQILEWTGAAHAIAAAAGK